MKKKRNNYLSSEQVTPVKMRIEALTLIIISVLSIELGKAAAKTCSEVLKAVENIPVPYDGISDPDNALDQTVKEKLRDRIHRISSSLTINREGRVASASESNGECRNENAMDNKKEEEIENIDDDDFPVQIVVAIVEQLDLETETNLDEDNMNAEELAKQFVMELHNSWGIGREITSDNGEGSTKHLHIGGTGVLVFLGIRDRILYISVGGALKHILTPGQLNRVIAEIMGPDLKRANYGLGLTKGIDAIAELLVKYEEPVSDLETNDPENWKQVFLVLVFVFGFLYGRNKRRQEERLYAKAAAQLSELDRARAEVLQGSYQRTTSCPICLEDFASTQCGSDGHPVQLLRCGHVFDKTCYEKWISSGKGDVTKCPVCRADVGIGREDPLICQEVDHSLSEGYQTPRSDDITRDNDDLHLEDVPTSEIEGGSSNESSIPNENDIRHNEPQMNVNIRYQVDRIFRLERLSELYPRYITPDAVTRWSSSSFDGSLVEDPSFRCRNPTSTRNVPSSASNTKDTNGGCVFDGGTSSGVTGGTF